MGGCKRFGKIRRSLDKAAFALLGTVLVLGWQGSSFGQIRVKAGGSVISYLWKREWEILCVCAPLPNAF